MSLSVTAAGISICPACRSERLTQRSECTRDEPRIGVLQCQDCEHVFLKSFAHVDDGYFQRNRFLESKPQVVGDIAARARHFASETAERVERLARMAANKRLLDVGCGSGEFLSAVRALCSSAEGVERTNAFLAHTRERGLTVHEELADATGPYDLITMFHVLEHLPEPVGTIELCLSKLAPNGVLYIEVPNINDALLSVYDCEAYRRIYFFKDHLHYFSRRSLTQVAQAAKAGSIVIRGHSRFSLSNHLHWLRHSAPLGHVHWSFLETEQMRAAYNASLASLDMSDSLIAIIKPSAKPS